MLAELPFGRSCLWPGRAQRGLEKPLPSFDRPSRIAMPMFAERLLRRSLP